MPGKKKKNGCGQLIDNDDNESYMQYPQTKFSDLQNYPSVQYVKPYVLRPDLQQFVG